MNTTHETDDGGGSTLKRVLVLVTAAAVASAIGLALADGYLVYPQRAQASEVNAESGAGSAPTAVQGGVYGTPAEPLEPELMRTDRANEHHG